MCSAAPRLTLHLDRDGLDVVRSRAGHALDAGQRVTVFDRRDTAMVRVFTAIGNAREIVLIGTARTVARHATAAAVEAGLAMIGDAWGERTPFRA